MTQDEAPAPPWLPELAAAIARTAVPPLLRPPAGVGRPSAILVLFGSAAPGTDGSDPDLLLIQRRPGLRRHGGQPAFPGGAIEPRDAGPVEADVGSLFPRSEWTVLSHRLIWHGRRVCHARRPACGACALARLCPSFGLGPVDPVIAAKLVKTGPFS